MAADLHGEAADAVLPPPPSAGLAVRMGCTATCSSVRHASVADARREAVSRMLVYWRIRCDSGHGWEVIDDNDREELPDDLQCPSGHEAVTFVRQRTTDL